MLKTSKPNIKKLLPKRKAHTHKGSYGRVLIYAGSEGMLGAAILCSRGTLRVGAGLVYLVADQENLISLNLATPEVVVIDNENSEALKPLLSAATAIAIGPGLGVKKGLAPELLNYLDKNNFQKTVILDADGLNAFVGKTKPLTEYKLDLIITPHPGEMASLLGANIDIVEKDREKSAKRAANLFNCTVVLKGHKTIVADKDGKIYLNNTGNPGMATAGAGDVLTGMIAGLAGQGLTAWEAATAGVYLHGLAGDLAAKEIGEYSLVSSNILEEIPNAIRKTS